MQLYGSFEEKGYKFEAYLPTSDTEPVAFEVRISVGDERKHVLLIPMTYVPVFGPDIDDVRHLESVVDGIIKFLPEPQSFNDESIVALDKLETEIGGKRAQERHPQLTAASDRGNGQFEYTGDLFAAKFADLLGGRDAMDQWMKAKLSLLGDRTPEEALRLGMASEVLKCLAEIAQQRLLEAGGASYLPPP